MRFGRIADRFGCWGEYVERAEDIGPAIERGYASGKVTVIHVPIDPKVNADDKPNYDEFRTFMRKERNGLRRPNGLKRMREG